MRSEKLVVLLIGIIVSVLLVCTVAGIALATASDDVTPVQAVPPPSWAVQADITEQYLNRTFMANTSALDAPVAITAGQLDIQPGNRIDFVVEFESPLGPLQATGTVTVAVLDGLIDIHIESLGIGQLPATQLMRLFRPDTEAEINAMANRMLLERAAPAGLRLEAITTDDAALHVYLAGQQ